VRVAAQKAHAKAVAPAKSATAVAVRGGMQKVAMPKAKRPSITTPRLKPKPKHAPKHATNAWPAKSAATPQKAATTHANLAANALSVENAAKAKAVVNAAHAASATKVAANARLAWMRTAIQKLCRLTTRQVLTAKRHKRTRTVANVVSAARVIVTAVTVASVVTVRRVKKVQQNTPATVKLLSTTTPRLTIPATSQHLKRVVSHARLANPVNLVSHEVSVKSAVNAKIAPHVTRPAKKRLKLRPPRQPLLVLACRPCKHSRCPSLTCKRWPKAVVWNG